MERVFLGLTASNGTTDSNGDGVSDLEKFLMGANPLEPGDALRIAGLEITHENHLLIRIPGVITNAPPVRQ